MVTRSIGNYIATSQFQYDVLKEMSEFVLENLKSCRCLGKKVRDAQPRTRTGTIAWLERVVTIVRKAARKVK